MSAHHPTRIRVLMRRLVGDLNWHPPAWLTWMGRNRRRVLNVAGTAFLALGGAFLAWRWYQGLPRPLETSFTVESPEVTCHACTPPGKPNPLRVRFSGSAAPLALTGKDLGEGAAIRMSPALKGAWHWDDDRTLSFQPAQDWPPGEIIRVRFPSGGFVPPQVHLDTQQFEFSAPAFSARVSDTQFHQDPIVAADKKIVLTLTFSHPVDPARLEKRINLRMFEQVTDSRAEDRGATPFTVVYDKLRLNAYIHSALLPVQQKPARLRIRIEPGVRALQGGNDTPERLESWVDIPGLYSLRADSMALSVARGERDDPSQVLIISLNHSVAERDLPPRVHAWRLPARHPDPRMQAAFEQNEHGPYRWTNQNINRDILTGATVLQLTQIPGELEHYTVHSFRHDAEPGEYVYVRLDRGLKSFGGYVLAETQEEIFRVPEFPREVRISQPGSLLAMSGSKALTVMTRDVPILCVDIGRLLPHQIQHLVSQTQGTFGAPNFRNWDFDIADITEHSARIFHLPASKPGTAHYQTVPLDAYLASDTGDRRGVFFVSARACELDEKGKPRQDVPERWNDNRGPADGRLVVVTDLGLLSKQSLDGSHDVFVQSIHTGNPLAGVRVEIVGRNGQTVLSGETDSDGHVHFPDLRSFKHEQQPVLYLARLAGDASFLPLEGRDRRLDLSRFDVGGVDNRVDRESLSAYLFSDRGLYRPGEEIHLGAIVRSQDWTHTLRGIPLRLEVTDPRGVQIRSEPFTPGPAGFSEIRQITRPTSPAGNYTLSISLAHPQNRSDLIGSTVVQVREFLPDRLRMTTHLSTESSDGWVSPDGLNARVDLQNLFGTPAAKRRVTGHMVLTPAFPAFKAYPDYRFYDPQATRQSFEETLSPTQTGDDGSAVLELNLQRFARATYRLQIATEGFEADGGRAVGSEVAQLVSNMPYLLGWKSDGNLEYVSLGAQRVVRLIVVDPAARRKDIADLRIERVSIRYVSTLIRQTSGTYQYESRRKESIIDTRAQDVPAEGLDLPLDTASPGAFAYVVRDRAGLQLARIDYQVAGSANLTRTLEKDAQLQITLARHDYSAGEEIEMQIQAPYVGSGLITIERDKVYAWRWFRTHTTSSTQTIRVPEGIEGNAYVHVDFVRDPGSDEIYASPLSYGVQPFSISLERRHNPVQLLTPAQVRPGETLEMRYSSARPARIAIFAVDEGVLQVARYRTPDPLGHFFQKRSLDVTTTQILDLILPEFTRGNRDAAAGGDQDSALARHLNPFARKGDKPVTYWSGIVDSDATVHSLKYEVPDYFNGTLRIFAVAVSDAQVGVQEARTLVRGEFVLSPNAPTTVTPGDEFEVSVGVANNLTGSGSDARIAVRLEPGPALEVLGEREQTLPIAENRESSARFRLRALDALGPAELRFTAGSGPAHASRRIDLSVRPATPFMTSLTAGALHKSTLDIAIDRTLYPQHRKLQASISLLPLSLAHGLVSYLGSYPYVCTEQLVSEAMPALVLADRPEFGYVRAQPGADLQGLINELRLRQNDAGAYRLWPGANHVEEFASLYAQHFLLEAATRGEQVPAGLIESGNGYVRSVAARDGNNLAQERNSAYAIYLLTRQGFVASAEAAALRKRVVIRYPTQWQRDIGSAWLAGAFKLMHQDRDARSAIDDVRFADDSASDPYGYNDAMTRDGFLMYLIARHFPEQLGRLSVPVLEKVAARMSDNSYHTLSAGSTLLGLDAFVEATHADNAKVTQLAIAEVLENRTSRPLSLPEGLMPQAPFSPEARALRFSSGSDRGAFYLVDQSGFDRTPPREALSKGFEILHEYTDEAGRVLTRIPLGAEVVVHLKFRAFANRFLDEVALVDLLPGGFDLVIPRQDSNVQGGSRSRWSCDFCRSQPDGLIYADPREDRVVFYGSVTPEVQELAYRIKATNIGTYQIPPAYGEAMYDRRVLARSVGGKIEVVRP